MTLLNRLGLRPKTTVQVASPARAQAEDSAVGHDFFFVRGHPRSGTNWVGALLNLHPQVNCFGEFHFEDIRNAIDQLQSQPWQITAREPLKTVMDRAFEDMVKRSILTLKERKPAARWIGDRTPRGLRIFVEHAPYFLILRDGRDVLVSWTYHVLRMRPHVRDAVVPPECRAQFDPLYDRFQADPSCFAARPHELLSAESWVRAIAGRWANWVRADNASLEAIHAGKKGCQARVMVLRYEELHAQTELWRRRMYEFLGLDPAEALPISAETRTSAGFEREDPTSFWRHGQPGDWKRHRTDDFARWFNEAAGQTLVDLGYETSARW